MEKNDAMLHRRVHEPLQEGIAMLKEGARVLKELHNGFTSHVTDMATHNKEVEVAKLAKLKD